MANTCEYKVKVKGTKKGCYAFYGSMLVGEEISIIKETGTKKDTTLVFAGDCKWEPDYLCTSWKDECPVQLPDNEDEVMEFSDAHYKGYTIQDRSRMFNVEVWCNFADVDEYDPNEGPYEVFEHYKSGEPIYDICPDGLHIGEEYEEYEEDEEDDSKKYKISKNGELKQYTGHNKKSYIPNKVISIRERAFEGCSTLQSIIIPDSVTNIGALAFLSCTSLRSVYIPASLVSPLTNVFRYCQSLSNIKVDDNNPMYKSIDGNLYTKDGKTLIQYATGKKDTTFEIPDFVENIGKHAFAECVSITSITIPDTVKSIDAEAFWGCSALDSVKLGKSLTSIGHNAFIDCNSLTSITIPENLTTLGGGIWPKSIINIDVDEKNTTYKSINGILYSKDGNTLLVYPQGRTDVSFTVPNFVLTIRSFYGNPHIKSVVIGNSVVSIEHGAFMNCSSLEKIYIPDSVTNIGDSAFWECSKLNDIIIPASITTMGRQVFYNCTNLSVNCVINSCPETWNPDWNLIYWQGQRCPVVWGYKE